MQELSQLEIAEVSGGTLDGAAVGLFKGALVGLAMAKYATGGGIGFGAIAQLVGFVAAPVIAGALGAGLGLVTDRATVDDFAETMSKNFGPGVPNTSGTFG